MNLGYDQQLYILAFDHRGSFQKKFFGIQGEPDDEQTAIIADAKHLIFEGMLQAVGAGADASATGVLVDEQFGSTVPAEAHEKGLKLAMPAERPARTCSTSSTATTSASTSCVRSRLHQGAGALQPRGRRAENSEQLGKLKRLSDWLKRTTASSCSSCWCPPRTLSSRPSAATATATTPSCPQLMRRAIAEIQDAGIVVDVWKIEGVDERSDCEMLVEQARAAGATASPAWSSGAVQTTPRSTTG